jgi:hypothetical protein
MLDMIDLQPLISLNNLLGPGKWKKRGAQIRRCGARENVLGIGFANAKSEPGSEQLRSTVTNLSINSSLVAIHGTRRNLSYENKVRPEELENGRTEHTSTRR